MDPNSQKAFFFVLFFVCLSLSRYSHTICQKYGGGVVMVVLFHLLLDLEQSGLSALQASWWIYIYCSTALVLFLVVNLCVSCALQSAGVGSYDLTLQSSYI